MRVCYDLDLVEGVVFLQVRRLQCGDGQLLALRYQHGRDELYEITDPDARNEAFYRFHLDWFRKLEFEQRLRNALRRFPNIEAQTDTLLVRKVVLKKDEGAELFARPDARNIALALRCERFLEADREVFLHHEFCHVADMLDPDFSYQPELQLPDAPPTELNLLRERYRVLWDITIDGRLRQDREKPRRQEEFDRAFAHVADAQRQQTFQRLWNGPRPSHPELLALARSAHREGRNGAGAACPLCHFPTFHWAEEGAFRHDIIAAIRRDFPRWLPELGACQRCLELYDTPAQQVPATLFL